MRRSDFEDPGKRINLTWFYPKICKFQDIITSQQRFFEFLDKEPENKPPVLLYIHIPFCESFCAYCACFKEPFKKYSYEGRKAFAQAMVKEMEMYSRKSFIKPLKIGYIQFGGGTPSCLESDLLEIIFQGIMANFDLSENQGVSLEGNVMSLQDINKIKLLKDLGLSRISFGVQTFNERLRKELAIKAQIKDIYGAVNTLCKVGIPYALDLIYNLPGEDFRILEQDLDRACRELNPLFIQTYQFNQFYNTALKKRIDSGHFEMVPTPQQEMEMFEFIMQRLKQNGYGNQVLINLFSDKAENPWTGIELSLGNNRLNGSYMLGLGPGSMSYLLDRNYRTCCSIKEYLEQINQGQFPVEAGHVCAQDELVNKVMVFFPNFTKVSVNSIPKEAKIEEKITYLREAGFVLNEDGLLKLTPKGKTWAGNVSYFFFSENEIKRNQTSFYKALKYNKNLFNQDNMNVGN